MGEWNIFSDMPKYKNMQVQQLEHWYSKCNAKEFIYPHEMGKQIKSSPLIKTLLQ